MYLLTYASNEDSDQPAHPRCLIRVFIVRMKKLCILSYLKCAQCRFWSDCANVQADLNLRWSHLSEGTFSHVDTHMLCYLFVLSPNTDFYDDDRRRSRNFLHSSEEKSLLESVRNTIKRQAHDPYRFGFLLLWYVPKKWRTIEFSSYHRFSLVYIYTFSQMFYNS